MAMQRGEASSQTDCPYNTMLKASEQIPKDKTMPKIYQISNPQTLTYFIPV
jgi:hypothetical protein